MPATAQSQPTGFLARRFRLAERGTNPRTEVLGGVATFLTMCYILFVNPAILSAAGIPFAAGRPRCHRVRRRHGRHRPRPATSTR
jgi:AGZA family xanthine/uracil permease-like MFS transporter